MKELKRQVRISIKISYKLPLQARTEKDYKQTKFVSLSPICSYPETGTWDPKVSIHKAITTQLSFGTKRTPEITSEDSQTTVQDDYFSKL